MYQIWINLVLNCNISRIKYNYYKKYLKRDLWTRIGGHFMAKGQDLTTVRCHCYNRVRVSIGIRDAERGKKRTYYLEVVWRGYRQRLHKRWCLLRSLENLCQYPTHITLPTTPLPPHQHHRYTVRCSLSSFMSNRCNNKHCILVVLWIVDLTHSNYKSGFTGFTNNI